MTKIEIVNEPGMVQVIAWDKEKKKSIYDWVKKSEVKRLVEEGYVLAIYRNNAVKEDEKVIKISSYRK